MQRLPCIWCAALSAAGQRSAACLRLSVVESAAVHPFAVCVLHAGGSAINAQLAPSSGISEAVCRVSGALCRHQQVSGQPLACICLRSNPAAVRPAAVCVLHAGGSAANAQLAPSSVISAAVAVHLVRCIISSRAEVSRLPASVCGRIRQRSACCMAGE